MLLLVVTALLVSQIPTNASGDDPVDISAVVKAAKKTGDRAKAEAIPQVQAMLKRLEMIPKNSVVGWNTYDLAKNHLGGLPIKTEEVTDVSSSFCRLSPTLLDWPLAPGVKWTPMGNVPGVSR